MTTLISYQSSGGDQGRCDAKCYNAVNSDCTCICGGENHGAGLERALENCRERAEEWVERAKADGQDIASITFDLSVQMEPLFTAAEMAGWTG